MVDHPSRRGRGWLLLAPLALLAWAGSLRSHSSGAPPGASPDREPALITGETIERELAGDGRHRFPLPLPTGRYLRIEADQRGIDIVLRLLSPDGSLVGEADGWTGSWGPDRLAFVTQEGGTYVLEVVAGNPRAVPGRYAVRLAEQGEGSVRNRRRAEGEAALASGRWLFFSAERGKLERAAGLFREALEAFAAAGDRAGQSDAHYAFAVTQLNLGRNDDAREAFERAVPMAQALGDPRREAEALVMRAIAYKLLGRAHDSLDDTARALHLWRTVPGGATEVNRVLQVLTGIYAELGDRANTDRYAELAVREARALGHEPYVLHEALHYYATAQLWLDRPERALAPLREAMTLAEGFGERQRPTTALLLRSLGAAQRRLGRHEEARATLERALQISRALGDRWEQASILVQLTGTYPDRADRARFRQTTEEALRVSREVGFAGGEASALTMLARDEVEAGDLREARRLVEEALRIHDERWRLVPTPHLQATYLSKNFAGHELYAEVLMRSWQEGIEPQGAALAFEAIEGARARGLQAQILRSREEARSGIPRELLAQRRILAAELLARISASRGSSSIESVAGIESLTAKLRGLDRQIRVLSPRYADLMLPEPIELSEVQASLVDEETVLLEVALGAKRSYVWVVGRSRVDVAELPGKEQVESAARALVDAVTARSASVRFETVAEREARIRAADVAVPELGRKLTAMVLAPVAPAIAGKRLAIVADGALQYVPWGALPSPRRDAPSGGSGGLRGPLPLAATNEIVHLPSAAALRAIRQRREHRATRGAALAVVADPVLDEGDPRLPGHSPTVGRRSFALAVAFTGLRSGPTSLAASWPALPYARIEAQQILAIAPPDARLGAFGFRASRRFVRDGGLKGHRIVHFATHAVMDGEQPERSGILLSAWDEEGRLQTSLLSLFDLYQLDLDADLVVLSGCRTGLGQDLRGEGLVGLTRGFMYAGAPRVVVSLWDVQDRATAVLMQRFYELLLRGGRSPAAALREAQLSMASSPDWSEPYYWAGFVLQGDWR